MTTSAIHPANAGKAVTRMAEYLHSKGITVKKSLLTEAMAHAMGYGSSNALFAAAKTPPTVEADRDDQNQWPPYANGYNGYAEIRMVMGLDTHKKLNAGIDQDLLDDHEIFAGDPEEMVVREVATALRNADAALRSRMLLLWAFAKIVEQSGQYGEKVDRSAYEQIEHYVRNMGINLPEDPQKKETILWLAWYSVFHGRACFIDNVALQLLPGAKPGYFADAIANGDDLGYMPF